MNIIYITLDEALLLHSAMDVNDCACHYLDEIVNTITQDQSNGHENLPKKLWCKWVLWDRRGI